MTFVMQHAPLPIEALVAMESYAHAAKFGRELAGELGGHIKWLLWRAGYTVVLVPPSTLKLFVTGKGNAAKDQVMMAVLKRWGFESPNNDVADSYGLARFAQSLGEPTQSVAVSAMAKKCTKLAGGTPA
jgi:crossover junction endodeoxyribonuclease RuvC